MLSDILFYTFYLGMYALVWVIIGFLAIFAIWLPHRKKLIKKQLGLKDPIEWDYVKEYPYPAYSEYTLFVMLLTVPIGIMFFLLLIAFDRCIDKHIKKQSN